MRSFDKMLKDKRVKVLTFVILLLALNSVYSTDNLNVPGLLHLVKKSDTGDEGLCIAFDEEAYSAVEWTYPIPEDENDLPETVSTYLPSQSMPYDCTFEENEECNKIWNMGNWTIPSHSSRNYIPIFDTRWEDFKTYLTTSKTKINENRFEFSKNSNIGISVRSGNSVDILLCQGYNPETYPCYTITLGGNTKKEVFIKKFGMNESLSTYKNDFPILSPDEWRTFNLSLSKTGQVRFEELNKKKVYLNVADPTPLNTLYLFMNSSLPSLWKIHRNHFLYTNVSQYISFGPTINVTSSNICLSMYLLMCKTCSVHFYKVKNSATDIVLEVNSTEEDVTYKWKHIKIILENITDDTVELFVKTSSNASDRFWAIDNIRSCISGEFKIRKLSKGNSNKKINPIDLSFSCHSLKFPEWRPKPQLVNMIGLPIVNNSQSTTSIRLTWNSSYQQPLIINFEGSDICRKDTVPQFKNRLRLNSNGWVMIKPNEKSIDIKNLVPYTHYSMLLVDPVYGINKTLSMNTNPTEKPGPHELPLIEIAPSVREATINISPRKCNVSYGPIVYGLNVIQKPFYHVVIDEIQYIRTELEPYTNYTLVVHIARTISDLNNTAVQIVKYYNFTTKPDVAPKLDFLEAYEVRGTSASFRYKLPTLGNGEPILLQVQSCTKLLKDNCGVNIYNISRCSLWDHLFCVTVEKLIQKANYIFKLSIKNNNTNAFGKETVISRKMVENVPGIPTNLSYNVINCTKETETCHLNASWSHPYNQTGAITYFEIFLSENDSQIIKAVPIKEYLPIYWDLIRGIPFAKSYNMSIRACNSVHKGTFASIPVQIDHIADHIHQAPKIIEMSENTVTFQVPKLDYRLNSSIITAIVQQNDSLYAEIPQKLLPTTEDSLCLTNKTTWVAGTWKMSHDDIRNITLGNNDKTFSDLFNDTMLNKPLSQNIDYCINFVIRSVYKNTEHVRIYYKKHITLTKNHQSSEESQPTVIYAMSTGLIITLTLLILLLIGITVLSILLYRKRCHNRNRRNRVSSDGDHIYETMPDDDFNESYNVVYNAMYDKLNRD